MKNRMLCFPPEAEGGWVRCLLDSISLSAFKRGALMCSPDAFQLTAFPPPFTCLSPLLFSSMSFPYLAFCCRVLNPNPYKALPMEQCYILSNIVGLQTFLNVLMYRMLFLQLSSALKAMGQVCRAFSMPNTLSTNTWPASS